MRVVHFSGSSVINSSIADGVYDLTVHSSLVTDASSNPMAGGDRVFTFHRLFGDFDGNGKVNNADYARFAATYGKKSTDPAFLAMFDFDGNGSVNNADYGQFTLRYGHSFVY